jgi:hypothetical protein
MEFKMRSVLAGAVLLLSVSLGFSAENESVPIEAPTSTRPANVYMQPIELGDHWTYEVKDDISGRQVQTRTLAVTDLSKDKIATRFDVPATGRFGTILFDQSWNIVTDSVWKYSPNDGTGVRLPLTSGARWNFTSDGTNSLNGTSWKRVGNSRVTGRESVTTKAGKFDTTLVETSFVMRNNAELTRTSETIIRTWYNDEINHWVKRNTVVRQNGLVFQNETVELVEYGRKN